MLFDRKNPAFSAYTTQNWDARLYGALFPEVNTHPVSKMSNFSCLLDERMSHLELGEGIARHSYQGILKLWLSEFEYCEIPLFVSFALSHEYYDHFINNFPLGYLSFSYVQKFGRTRPSLEIVLNENNGRADEVSLLFVEAKTIGTKPLSISWSTDLSNLKGLNAEKAWGNWNAESHFDTYGKLIGQQEPGRRAFSLESVTFSIGQ
jgi:hypothetical protein